MFRRTLFKRISKAAAGSMIGAAGVAAVCGSGKPAKAASKPVEMKSMMLTHYDVPHKALKLAQQAVPTPGANDVLVKVHATSLNPIDARMRSGYGHVIFSQRAPLPIVLGRDFAGTVVETGASVTDFKVGDKVWGVVSPFRATGLKNGAHSEYVCVPQAECAQMPSQLDFTSAASLPYVALTTWSALIVQSGRTPASYAGKKVLVHAGAGGVGTFAIQFLKHHGAFVASTCSKENMEFVRSLGADQVIDYKSTNYTDILKDYDVVYDLLGKSHTDPSLSVLASNPCSTAVQDKISNLQASYLQKLEAADEKFSVPQYKALLNDFDREVEKLVSTGAVYVAIVGPMMPLTDSKGLHLGMKEYVRTVLQKKTDQWKFHGRKFNYSVFEPNVEGLQYVTQLVSAGKIKPHVTRVHTLENAADAHVEIETGRTRGKIVLTP